MSGVKTSHSMGGARADRAPSVLQPPILSYPPPFPWSRLCLYTTPGVLPPGSYTAHEGECIVAVQGAGCVFAAARARASVVRLSVSSCQLCAVCAYPSYK
eukprot:scaffold17619_cov128-Isochrysis_galbana.AAC.1